VAVPYRAKWFWIADRDLRTKRAFAFMLMLLALADTGEKESLPLITIPAQGTWFDGSIMLPIERFSG
jgi:hypothetical protein